MSRVYEVHITGIVKNDDGILIRQSPESNLHGLGLWVPFLYITGHKRGMIQYFEVGDEIGEIISEAQAQYLIEEEKEDKKRMRKGRLSSLLE